MELTVACDAHESGVEANHGVHSAVRRTPVGSVRNPVRDRVSEARREWEWT